MTADPARTIVGGSSYGGLAAAFAGLRASDIFGNVLLQSGSFWVSHRGSLADGLLALMGKEPEV